MIYLSPKYLWLLADSLEKSGVKRMGVENNATVSSFISRLKFELRAKHDPLHAELVKEELRMFTVNDKPSTRKK